MWGLVHPLDLIMTSRWIIAFPGTLVLLLAQGFGRMSYSMILPSMKDGLLLTYTQVGLIGPAVAGWIRDTTGTFAGAFILSAGISLLGAARSMIFRKKA
jgi:hypothetical protein